jgi:hypothetical protein
MIIMQMNKIPRISEKPARPINRRWARYIGPYGWPDEFVKEHYNRVPIAGGRWYCENFHVLQFAKQKSFSR